MALVRVDELFHDVQVVSTTERKDESQTISLCLWRSVGSDGIGEHAGSGPSGAHRLRDGATRQADSDLWRLYVQSDQERVDFRCDHRHSGRQIAGEGMGHS